jgi:hypothetical protein
MMNMKMYQPETARGKMARHVEGTARFFSEEHLTRETFARCLLLEPAEISEEEWTEIYEFSLNAGTDIIRAMVRYIHPEPIDEQSYARLEEPGRAKELYFSPRHDIFHAAEIYRLQGGVTSAPEFFSSDKHGRYLTPKFAVSELYVQLFDAPEWLGVPLPVALQVDTLRKRVDEYLAKSNHSDRHKSALHGLLGGTMPQTTDGWMTFWESFTLIVNLGNAAVALKDMTVEDEQIFTQGYEEELRRLPEHYIEFASRVFDVGPQTNRRLFLDEFLLCIRTKPAKKS